jgi:hypothetical protein
MRTDRQHISLDIRLNLNKTRFRFPLSQNNLLGLSLGIMNGIVVERLQELSRLKERWALTVQDPRRGYRH